MKVVSRSMWYRKVSFYKVGGIDWVGWRVAYGGE